MPSRSIVVSLAVLLGAPSVAMAAGRSLTHVDGGYALASGRQHRGSRRTAFVRPPGRTLASLEADVGRVWASWDHDTGVPSRVILAGTPAPGTSADPSTAADVATDLLARHIDVLAPGSDPSDFVLVTNDLSAGIRSVGFMQHHRGLPVVGGQISVRFKHDHVSVIASDAYPDVGLPVAPLPSRPSARTVTDRAAAWLEDDGLGVTRRTSAVQGPFVLPIVDDAGALSYSEVFRTVVDTGAPFDRFEVYVDAHTGDPVARRSLLMHATAQIDFNVPVRGPLGARSDLPAAGAEISEGDAILVTSALGEVEFVGPNSDLVLSARGPLVAVANGGGDDASASFPASNGSTIAWGAANDEFVDAQLTSFAHAQVVKAYVRNVAPDLAWLDNQLSITTNIDEDESCNAASDGDSLYFRRAYDGCENTGRIADVVYHEFGHSVHTQSVLPGVGFFDVALSEGTSDYLSATITDDSGIGRGFFLDDSPLRELDPQGQEYRWPDDRGEVHAEGRIIGGALWDLRELLIAKHGAATGVALTDRIWYEATRRAVNIPSMYVETLLVDDDDGNLSNGTPNGCEINAAFGPHGLFTAGDDAETVSITDLGSVLEIDLALEVPQFPACPVDAAPVVEWRVRDDLGQAGTEPMAIAGDGFWFAPIPAITDEVMQYQVKVNYSTGTERPLPDNFVDPWYEVYVGDVVPIYCLADDPGASAWTLDAGGGWQVSPPLVPDPNDPPVEADGDGIHIGQAGPYPPFTNSKAVLDVETAGFSDVRLQYWRWLTVEDGYFDRATILVDGAPVWRSFGSADEKSATFHHTDREWRFHDVDLSGHTADGRLTIEFGLESDGGLEFGGWSIDGLCVVGVGAPASCGDGVRDAVEECDDGNRVSGDGCSAQCTVEDPSTGGGETGESGEPGGASSGDTDGIGDTDGVGLRGDGLLDRGCACRTRSRDPAERGPWVLLALGLLGLRRRGRNREV